MSFLAQWLIGGIAFMVVLIAMLTVLLVKQQRAANRVAEGKPVVASCACGSRESCDDDDDCDAQIYQIGEPGKQD